MTRTGKADEPPAGSTLPQGDAGVAADAARFSQKELRELSFEISARWFSREPAPRLTLSVVHPWRIHAYWHITPGMMQQALANTTAPQALVIRFSDLTPGQSGRSSDAATFDVEVDGLDNSWYIDLWQSDRRYVAELALRGADDTLHVFVHSDEIQVPRAEPSPALEFSLGQYQGGKEIAETPDAREYASSIAHLTSLLPPFNGFPDIRQDAAIPTLAEPEFPAAPLARAQDWDEEPALDGTDAFQVPERFSFGTEFPMVGIEAVDASPADGAKNDSPIDYTMVPELPEIDPHTVSDSTLVSTSSPPPELLPAKEADTAITGSATREKESHPLPPDRTFPEVRADILHPGEISQDAALASDHGTGIFQRERATSALPPDLGPSRRFAQSTTTEPDTDDGKPAPVHSGPGGNPRTDAPTPPYSATETGAPPASDEQWSVNPRASAGPAPLPLLPLEEAIAASYFSATSDDNGLDLSVQLELTGICSVDQLLTLFGEPVHVDEQGHFAVRVKLSKGPQLAALLRTQRRNRSEHH